MNAIVCYYSWHGHTAAAGKAIAEAVKGREVAIVEVKKRRGIFGWLDAGRRAMQGTTSAIQPLNVDWGAYDTVFIGTPTWASSPSSPVNSLLQQANLTGKKVYLFTTSDSPDAQPLFDKLAPRVTAKGAMVAGQFHVCGKVGLEGIAQAAREWASKLQ
jgi:flavodoxin